MSCGRIALTELKIPIEQYYASEIDKHAIKQTQLNFPDTIQLGDVTKWKEWDIDWAGINLLLAGSPCQGFSFAGKQLAFDDPRSKLFFVFIDILNHIKKLNPDVFFLLENVNMKRSHMRIISEFCGVFPVNINSNLVSAQNRDRWYWTNIRTKQVGLFGEVYVDIPQPEDKGIFLRDILEDEVDEKYYIKSGKALKYITDEWRVKKKYTQIDSEGKSIPLMARGYASWCGDYVCIAMRGREDGLQHFEPQATGKTNCLTSVQKDNLILQRPRGNNKGGLFEGKSPTLSTCSWEQNNLLCTKEVIQLNPSTDSGGTQPYQQDRIYDVNGISPSLCVGHGGVHPNIVVHNMMPRSSKNGNGGTGHLSRRDGKTYCLDTGQTNAVEYKSRIRRLTPLECSRLQTVPSWYKWECSDTQAYKMLGNGWTVDVIVHLLSFMRLENN